MGEYEKINYNEIIKIVKGTKWKANSFNH
jgi:hypothetical protein